MPGFDMHIHTTASDGTLHVGEVVQLAVRIGLDGVAITDHDTIGGLDQAVDIGEKCRYPVIPGIELSTEFQDKEIHILGYFIDFHLSWVREKIAQLQNARRDRVGKMVAKLKKLGYDVEEEEVFAIGGEGSVGRPHVAHVLQHKGYVSSLQEAFQQLIGRGCKAYVPRFKMTPPEAINLVKDAGGIPVLAHPGLSQADYLIPSLCTEGLMGLEVFHPDHKINDESKYLKIAKAQGLIVTGGSDFHGSMGGDRSALGSKTVPSDIWDELMMLKNRGNI